MMQDRTSILMRDLEKHIQHIFEEVSSLKQHLKWMNMYPDMEWFNIAAVLWQKPNAKMVKSITGWRKYFNNVEVYPKQGTRSCVVFVSSFKDDSLVFETKKVFDISQMNTSQKPENISPLKNRVDKLGGNREIEKFLSNEWAKILIESVCESYELYRSVNTETKQFVKTCIEHSAPTVFHNPSKLVVVQNLQLDKSLQLYKMIKEIIEMIPITLIRLFEEASTLEKEKEAVDELEVRTHRNISKRIEHAHRIINNRLITKDEMNSLDELVDDYGGDVPPDAINEQIYTEDVM